MDWTFKTSNGNVRWLSTYPADLLGLAILCIPLHIRADTKYNSVACITYI